MDQLISQLQSTTISTVSSLDIETKFRENFNQVFSFDNNDIKVVGTIDKPWFRAKDVLKILGYSDNTSTTNNYISKYIPMKYKQELGKLVENCSYNDGKQIFISKEGLEHLICRTTKLNIDTRRKLIDIFKLNCVMYESKEQNTLIPIIKVLKKYKCYHQFQVKTYRIDLYIPEIKLAIECDEYNHNHYDESKEKEREEEIKDILKCEFFRYNPNKKDFNIFDTIGDLLIFIDNLQPNSNN